MSAIFWIVFVLAVLVILTPYFTGKTLHFIIYTFFYSASPMPSLSNVLHTVLVIHSVTSLPTIYFNLQLQVITQLTFESWPTCNNYLLDIPQYMPKDCFGGHRSHRKMAEHGLPT